MTAGQLETLAPFLNDSFTNFQRQHQPSLLWVAEGDDSADSLISAVTLCEVELAFTLTLQIANLELIDLTLQITPETLLIRGSWNQRAQVGGCFCPAPWQSLIPLPHAVFPESSRAEQQGDWLRVHLVKQQAERSFWLRPERQAAMGE